MMKAFKRYPTFRSYFWKLALPTLGLPFGLGLGIFYALDKNNWQINGIFTRQTPIPVVIWLIAGFLFAYFSGRSRWKRMKEYEASLKEGNDDLQE